MRFQAALWSVYLNYFVYELTDIVKTQFPFLVEVNMQKLDTAPQTHSNAWIVQSWAAFVISVSATTAGIFCLPVDGWVKSYVGMGTVFSITSTFSLSKTVRDIHESKRLISRVDEAKLEKILAEHDPFKR